MRREKSKGRPPEDESTDARHRGGTARSSEEAPVMGAERRGCVVQGVFIDQPGMGGISEYHQAIRLAEQWEPDELRGSRPVLRAAGGEIPPADSPNPLKTVTKSK
jgi:hypothetical protein